MDRNRRKFDREAPIELDPSFGSLDELRNVGVTWVERRIGVNDAYYRPCKGVFAIAKRLDKDLAQKE